MSETPRRWLPVLILAVAAFLAVLPLVLHGCSCGHDFDFHLVNWLEANAQFRHGVFHPHWAFTGAWAAGEPRFVFYPPLSWTIGGMLGFIMPFTAVPTAYTWLCLFLAGLSTYRLARSTQPSNHPAIQLAIAVLYLANPYILFTAYERTAYAELLAAAWMPLLLTALLRKHPRALEIALPIALLWLTNAPAAVVGCYSLLFLGLLRTCFEKDDRLRLVTQYAGGTVLGIALAGFYIVPAAYERRWVQVALAIVEGVRPQDNFLFGHTSDPLHDTVLWQASRIAVGMLALTLILAVALRKHREARLLLVFTLIVASLLLPISMPVWRHAPQLAFLQFPWRFLSMLQAVAAVLLALAVRHIRIPHPRVAWVAVATVTTSLIAFMLVTNHFYRQGCDEEDAAPTHIALFKQGGGVLPTDEYTVNDADNDLLQPNDPPWWIANSPQAPVPVPGPGNEGRVRPPDPVHHPEDATWNTEHTKINLLWPKSFWLVINRRAFPAWRVSINDVTLPVVERPDGLMAIPVPAGHSEVRIDFQYTADHSIGQFLTALSALTALALYRRQIGQRKSA